MGKFLCGVVLGASIMGMSVWAVDIHMDNSWTIPATNVVLAECVYKKDGVWQPITHVTIDQNK